MFKRDCYGFADILAIKGDICLLVQTTSGSNVAARIAKIKAEPRAAIWLAGVNRRIVVHGWRRVGARGKRKVWQCREVVIMMHDPHLGTLEGCMVNPPPCYEKELALG